MPHELVQTPSCVGTCTIALKKPGKQAYVVGSLVKLHNGACLSLSHKIDIVVLTLLHIFQHPRYISLLITKMKTVSDVWLP